MENIFNFRDIGGISTKDGLVVKKGLVFRSAKLSKASPDDLERLSALGIRTICDLRTTKEKQREPDRIPLNVNYIHVPIKSKRQDDAGVRTWLLSSMFGKARKIDYFEAYCLAYQEFASDFLPEFRSVMKIACDADSLPLLVHCTAGKDRTGLACSFIQLSLGVPIETVMADYLLTNDYLFDIKLKVLGWLKFLSLFGVTRQRLLPIFEARPEFLYAAFDKIKKDHITEDNFFKDGLGLSRKEKERMQLIFLEKLY